MLEAAGSVRVTRVPLPVFLDKHPEGGLLGPVVLLCLASRGPNMLVGMFKWLAPPAFPGPQASNVYRTPDCRPRRLPLLTSRADPWPWVSADVRSYALQPAATPSAPSAWCSERCPSVPRLLRVTVTSQSPARTAARPRVRDRHGCGCPRGGCVPLVRTFSPPLRMWRCHWPRASSRLLRPHDALEPHGCLFVALTMAHEVLPRLIRAQLLCRGFTELVSDFTVSSSVPPSGLCVRRSTALCLQT